MRVLPILSIIMPLYNVEAYLATSVNSVLAQDFTAFELILADDGSTDASSSLCTRLAATDPRIRLLHLPHSGTSAARNAGIDAAQGEFIGFVDADDWIEPDMFSLLYENSLTHDAQISACAFIKITNDAALQFCTGTAASLIYTPAEALERTFRLGHMRYSACNKLFRRRLFDDIRYPENLHFEDKATTYKLIHRAQRIVWCPSPKYHYYMRPGSVMHEGFSKTSLDLLTVNEELLLFLKTRYPALVTLAEGSYAAECMKLVMAMKAGGHRNDAVFDHCMDRIRQSFLPACRYPVTDAVTRLRMLAACAYPDFFRCHER